MARDLLLEEAERLDSLRDVLEWAFGLSPPAEFVDAVAQDEFTFDVVLRHPSGVYLVFDTT